MVNFNIEIVNIVATAHLGVRIPLEKMTEHLEGTEYEPEQFPGLVYRIKDPKAATLIFSSGKVVCAGARSIEDVNITIKKVVKVLRESGIADPKKYEIEVQNIVASAQIPAKLDLDKIALEVENSEYEPAQFPGVIYRMKDPKATFLLFGSGKVICTGTRKVEEVNNVVNSLFKKLKSIDGFRNVK